jgi:hypothetical protein
MGDGDDRARDQGLDRAGEGRSGRAEKKSAIKGSSRQAKRRSRDLQLQVRAIGEGDRALEVGIRDRERAALRA